MKKRRKIATRMLLFIMLIDILRPTASYALTSGPSQPEFQGFEPLGRTQLVDPFSGDFSYNIPLLDIEGYPLNLTYRSGSSMEEEASWVGLGWNLNTGNLNRLVRGLPDDMDGENIPHFQNMKHQTIQVNGKGIGADVGISAGIGFGSLGVSASVGASAERIKTETNDNYYGQGIGIVTNYGASLTVSATVGGSWGVSAGLNGFWSFGASGIEGATISQSFGWTAGLLVGSSSPISSIGIGVTKTKTYNSIAGHSQPQIQGTYNIGFMSKSIGLKYPMSLSNVIPTVMFPSMSTSIMKKSKLRVGIGFGVGDFLSIGGGISPSWFHGITIITHKDLLDLRGYGYQYLQNADLFAMKDFSRDKDGPVLKNMPYLSPTILSYDIYSSTVPGGEGVYRNVRDDFGTVNDVEVFQPNMQGSTRDNFFNIDGKIIIPSIKLEYINTRSTSFGTIYTGPAKNYSKKFNGKSFMKMVGEKNSLGDEYYNQIKGEDIIDYSQVPSLRSKYDENVIKANAFLQLTEGQVRTYPEVVSGSQVRSYNLNSFPPSIDSSTSLDRWNIGVTGNASKTSEITHTTQDGRMYVYGIPVKNNLKNEVVFRTNNIQSSSKYNEREGTLEYGPSEASKLNPNSRDAYYQSKLSPSYAYSYLLSYMLSPDYRDITGNGVTDDDHGRYVKFNYSKTESDYRWRMPYCKGGTDGYAASLNKGTNVSKFDDVGSFSAGSKEIWYPHSIESKHHLIEFYISEREDALDSRAEVVSANHPKAQAPYDDVKSSHGRMMKLDSIKYYHKEDRYVNGSSAVPIKTIIFGYDYSLCPGIPNSNNAGGKLTLKSVKVKYGNSRKGLLSPYTFEYESPTTTYNQGNKNSWGNYFPNNQYFPLGEFPYPLQEELYDFDGIAATWNMNKINLPSGGSISVDYESDDYAYVQDRRAMQFVNVAGVGPTQDYIGTDALGLYLNGLGLPYEYIYIQKPTGYSGNGMDLLNNDKYMYYSFLMNIAGDAFNNFDQVKGYVEIAASGICPNATDYLYFKVKKKGMLGSSNSYHPISLTALNKARMEVKDLLYFQTPENSSGQATTAQAENRLDKAKDQLKWIRDHHNIQQYFIQNYNAGRQFNKNGSYVKIKNTNGKKKGGGVRVARVTYDNSWNEIHGDEKSDIYGYNYEYTNESNMSSGVASYEPIVGGEENPFRAANSYYQSNQPADEKPPHTPIELLQEDPAGESFYPTPSVGYSKVRVTSIHKDKARSAQTEKILEFYTAKDFPVKSKRSTLNISESHKDDDQFTWSNYGASQAFVFIFNDMHGKEKSVKNYRVLPRSNTKELVTSSEYIYSTKNMNELDNYLPVIDYTRQITQREVSNSCQGVFYEGGLIAQKKHIATEIDVNTDAREFKQYSESETKRRGGSLTFSLLPPWVMPGLSAWENNFSTHEDVFQILTTTKVVQKYGVLTQIRETQENATTNVYNQYYDPITGAAVVQRIENEYGDDQFITQIPAYWTESSLGSAAQNLGQTIHTPYVVMSTPSGGGLFSSPNMIQGKIELQADRFRPGDEIIVSYTPTSYLGSRTYAKCYVTYVETYNPPPPSPSPNTSIPLGGPLVTPGSPIAPSGMTVYFSPRYIEGGSPSATIQLGDTLFKPQMTIVRSGHKNELLQTAMESKSLYSLFGDTMCTPAVPNAFYALLSDFISGSNKRFSSRPSVYDHHASLDSLELSPVLMGYVANPYVYESATFKKYRNYQDSVQRKIGYFNDNAFWHVIANIDTFAGIPAPLRIDNPDNFDSRNTQKIPDYPVTEAVNPVGIYNAAQYDRYQQVTAMGANVRSGHFWAETFEDYGHWYLPNDYNDFTFSPIRAQCTASYGLSGTPISWPNYVRKDSNQVILTASTNYNVKVTTSNAHTGKHSLYAPSGLLLHFTPTMDTILNANNNIKPFQVAASTSGKYYMISLWVKNGSANMNQFTIGLQTSTGTQYTNVQAASAVIDGWQKFEGTFAVLPNHTKVVINFPSGGYYDDLRLFPLDANLRTYVYDIYNSRLQAILDENNYASFYEYDAAGVLVRTKKETDKGILTLSENRKVTRTNTN